MHLSEDSDRGGTTRSSFESSKEGSCKDSRNQQALHMTDGNQHARWLNCRHCGVRGAIQTLDLMSCVNCSLAHIYMPQNDRRRTCVWTRWLTMIARNRFRMTDAEKAIIQERILRCQERRRMRAIAPIPEAEEDPPTAESQDDHRVSAVSVGAVKATGSEDHYCMLDSGANVMVIPWKEGMEGDHTMCALVGDNKTEVWLWLD